MENKNQKQEPFDLESLQPNKIAEHERVKQQFVMTLVKIHKMSESEADSVYEREQIYYKKALMESDRLQKSTKLSLYSSFIEIAVTGLSIQPGAKSEAYIEPRSAKAKDANGNDAWISSARLVITAYGELSLRIRAGQIVRMCNPQVIYAGDHFQPKTNDRGDLIVDYHPAIPRQSDEIIGCYVCLILPHNGRDFKWLLMDDVERLKNYSKPKTGTNPQPNALYTSGVNKQIDTGFLETKTIKHAMRTLTKLRVSNSVSFEDEDPEALQTPEPFAGQSNGAQPAQPQDTTVTVKLDENAPF